MKLYRLTARYWFWGGAGLPDICHRCGSLIWVRRWWRIYRLFYELDPMPECRDLMP